MMKKSLTKNAGLVNNYNGDESKAIAVFRDAGVSGDVIFIQRDDGKCDVRCRLIGFSPQLWGQKVGMHIHQYGDISSGKGCASVGSHYNPLGRDHGGHQGKDRHVGDLGNIAIRKDGSCWSVIKGAEINLGGRYGVVGRGLVIHAHPDDLGRGGDNESLKTGHSGERIGCAVIGWMK